MLPIAHKIKRTLFAHAPFANDFILSSASRVRRTLRLPHQRHYTALKLINDNPRSLYLDVGANRGQSIESISLYKPNRIVSFEANPLVAKDLRVRYPDAEIYAFGLGKCDGEFVLYVPAYKNAIFTARASLKEEAAQSFIQQRPVYGFSGRQARIETVTCSVRTLDSLGLTPGFIKIDVEGMELDVIEGGMKTIRNSLPIIMLESPTPAILEKLAPLGYRSYGYVNRKLEEGRIGEGDAFLVPDSRKDEIA